MMVTNHDVTDYSPNMLICGDRGFGVMVYLVAVMDMLCGGHVCGGHGIGERCVDLRMQIRRNFRIHGLTADGFF